MIPGAVVLDGPPQASKRRRRMPPQSRRDIPTVLREGQTRPKRPNVHSELQCPHSPIGRGSGLKIRTVWVRVPVGARESRR
ncbi:MAG: hypothetical protein QOE89_1154 [Pseudonocardiales bacterium]|nr:hypothetical protein [Pseudonocardiales bacterium]